MKKILLILPLLLLAGCFHTVPVKRHFPEIPEEFKKACPELEQVDPATTKLSEVIRVVTDNYAQYHECRVKIDAWIEWYGTQRKIFEEVK